MPALVILQTHVECPSDELSRDGASPTLVVHGNTLDGAPVRVLVSGFLPYFYVQPSTMIDPGIVKNALKQGLTRGCCHKVEPVERYNIYGYASAPSQFLKISFSSPWDFKPARDILSRGISAQNGERVRFKLFESNYPFVLRFMTDTGLAGMSYMQISSYQDIGAPFGARELTTTAANISPLPPTGEYMKLPPLKILSFDIECCTATSGFPDASRDPVIQIGNTVQRLGSDSQERVIFCLHETAPLPDGDVRWFHDETALLLAWREYLLATNPDIITGYNIKGFDFPYIFGRAEALGIREFARLGRAHAPSRVVNRQQASSAFGAFDAKDVSIAGRLVIDVLHIVRREHKLRSYSLNAVSYHFLREQKEDVPHTSMYALQNGDPETRRRIASYCLRDTHLPLRLLDKLNIIVNYAELARVTGVPFEYFFTRGATVKVLAQLYKEAGRNGYLIPDMDVKGDEAGFEGAVVMEPLKGFYAVPIAVLDFCSLYPSIIISKNLCYTTLLTRAQYAEIGGIETPTGNHFCAPTTRRGLLPRVLENLLSARKEARACLKNEKDPWMRRALDARQLALKVCANSIYGFTGSFTGQMPCIEISQSTTGFGRQMIAETKAVIEEHFTYANGFDFDAQIVYGDTDSVMVNFLRKPVRELKSLSSGADCAPEKREGVVKEENGGALCSDTEGICSAENKDAPGNGDLQDKLKITDAPANELPPTNLPEEARGAPAPDAEQEQHRLEDIFTVATKIGEFVSARFEKPVSLAFEKVYCPFLLINKKRYAGFAITAPNSPGRVDMKGIEAVRRDNCELVKNLVQSCLDCILINNDVNGAVRLVRDTVRDLYADRIDMSQLVISKTYTKADYTAKQAHTTLVEKLRSRGHEVDIGERIPYVIVKGDKKALASEKSEDPLYVIENGLAIDKEYYIEQQLSKPLHRIFEPIMSNVSALFRGAHAAEQNVTAGSGPLDAFVHRVEECVGCHRPGAILCTACRVDFPHHHGRLVAAVNEKTARFNACWVQCQRCQGSLMNEVLCVNRICPIWYMRMKIKKELGALESQLDKMERISW